jgi:hypothetical protein
MGRSFIPITIGAQEEEKMSPDLTETFETPNGTDNEYEVGLHPGNLLNPDFSSPQLPSSWGEESGLIVIDPDYGGALWRQIDDPASPTGYRFTGSLMLQVDGLEEGDAISAFVSKPAAGPTWNETAAWRLYFYKEEDQLQMILVLGLSTVTQNPSAVVYSYPITTNQYYDVEILYDTAGRSYSWFVNGELHAAGDMPDDYPLIGTKVIGSSGSSIGRNSVFVVDNVRWDEVPETITCFCRGTLILTDRGEVPVEELAVGDRVRVLSGGCKPIVWIGFGRDLLTRANRLARPIVVRAGALADQLPRRDLYLTHGHALYLEGVLIPVEQLVNHHSIAWDETARVVEYYHIELEAHDVLFAEGAPAESYYDSGNRAAFQNTRVGSLAGGVKPTFAPVLSRGEIVETVWAELFERAGGQLEFDTSDDSDLHLVLDGERIDPTAVDGSVYSFAVKRKVKRNLRLCSRSGVPSLLGLGRRDHRRLGVAIKEIILHHAGLPTCFDYDAPQLRVGGCHPKENGYCWTDGELELPARFFTLLNGGFMLVVHTAPHYDMRYPIPSRIAQAA